MLGCHYGTWWKEKFTVFVPEVLKKTYLKNPEMMKKNMACMHHMFEQRSLIPFQKHWTISKILLFLKFIQNISFLCSNKLMYINIHLFTSCSRIHMKFTCKGCSSRSSSSRTRPEMSFSPEPENTSSVPLPSKMESLSLISSITILVSWTIS